MSLLLDTEKCIRCARCISECPVGIFGHEDSGVVAIKDALAPHCITCGHCVAVCPKAAIELDSVNSMSLRPITPAPLNETQQAMLFTARRSVRTFKKEPVPHATILAALEDARYAPTAINMQNLEWIVVDGREKMYELGQAMAHHMTSLGGFYSRIAAKYSPEYDPFLRKAPMLIVAHTPLDSDWRAQDAAIAATTLELSLHSRGVGVTWCGYFMIAWRIAAAQNSALPHIPLPEGRSIEAALMVGMPAVHYARVPSRKPVRVQFI